MERLTYSIREAAAIIGVSPRTVMREIQRGRLATIRVGRLVRIPVLSLQAAYGRGEPKAAGAGGIA
jgi:excisionase family DNA binding protein